MKPTEVSTVEQALGFEKSRPPDMRSSFKEFTMKTMQEYRRLFSRRLPIWLAALAVATLLPIDAVRAQRRPPTIPNTNGPVTIRSTVGGPNAIPFTFGGAQPWQPAPMTFSPAVSPPSTSTWPTSGGATYIPPTQPMTFAPALPPPPQQPPRIFYVYYRLSTDLPWTCFGGYYNLSQVQQAMNWLRQNGGDAIYR